MKVAIWGFGNCGRRVFEILNTAWADRYEITAIFDRSFDSMEAPEGSAVFCHPDEIIPRFAAGDFEGVFACAGNPLIYREFKRTLEDSRIPILSIAPSGSMVPADSLDCVVNPQVELVDDGYTITTCQGLYGFVHETYSQKLFVYHDGNGHIVLDSWFKGSWEYDVASLQFTQRYDHAPDNYILLPGDYCAVNRFWGGNYWHFTFQHLDQIAVMEAAGFKGTYILERASFAPEIMAMLSIPPERLLWINDLDNKATYRFERVSFLHQKGYIYRQQPAIQPLLRCAKTIERVLDERFDYRILPKRLFVKRIGTRKLIGAERTLENNGFVTIVPEDHSVSEQMAHFRAADIVITPHGANSSNSLYMKPKSVFIEAFSHDWGMPICVKPLYAKGVSYLSIPGRFDQTKLSPDIDADFKVDATLLQMAIRNAEHLLEHNRIGTRPKLSS